MQAYEKAIVPVVQDLLGNMFDFAVYGLEYSLKDFYKLFLDSVICKRIEHADSTTVMGHSGIELCYDITEKGYLSESQMNKYTSWAVSGRSREYWTGWALAYYQWITMFSFKSINEIRSVDDVADMYDICHEMDISQFVDRMNVLYREQNPYSRLKKQRMNAGISQKELADITMIPIKTIQQYEQRRKNINNASVDYVIKLSRALKCDVEMLLEL